MEREGLRRWLELMVVAGENELPTPSITRKAVRPRQKVPQSCVGCTRRGRRCACFGLLGGVPPMPPPFGLGGWGACDEIWLRRLG